MKTKRKLKSKITYQHKLTKTKNITKKIYKTIK
jgi:hypothetical protein